MRVNSNLHLKHVTTNDFYNRMQIYYSWSKGFLCQTVVTPKESYTRTCLHQKTFNRKCTLHQSFFTPKGFYTRTILHQINPNNLLYTLENLYARNCVHKEPFTPEISWNKNLLCSKSFTAEASYTQIILRQTTFSPTSFTPETVCTRSLLRQFFCSNQLWHQRASHQTLFSPERFHARNLFAPELYTRSLLHPFSATLDP